VANSFCFGLFNRAIQFGLAWVVTDFASFANLCDVYVLESHPGRDLDKWETENGMAPRHLAGLRRITLVTRDALGWYVLYGFRTFAGPENHLEQPKPDIYKTGMGGEQSAGAEKTKQ